jgi:hypothetical protein
MIICSCNVLSGQAVRHTKIMGVPSACKRTSLPLLAAERNVGSARHQSSGSWTASAIAKSAAKAFPPRQSKRERQERAAGQRLLRQSLRADTGRMITGLQPAKRPLSACQLKWVCWSGTNPRSGHDGASTGGVEVQHFCGPTLNLIGCLGDRWSGTFLPYRKDRFT